MLTSAIAAMQAWSCRRAAGVALQAVGRDPLFRAALTPFATAQWYTGIHQAKQIACKCALTSVA